MTRSVGTYELAFQPADLFKPLEEFGPVGLYLAFKSRFHKGLPDKVICKLLLLALEQMERGGSLRPTERMREEIMDVLRDYAGDVTVEDMKIG